MGRILPACAAALCVLAAAALPPVACAPRGEVAPPESGEPIALADGPGAWRIRWDAVAPGDRAPVFYGPAPDAIDRSRAVATMTGREVRVSGLPAGERPFFELRSARGGTRIVSPRLVPMEGAHNFRDYGGYGASDGRTVRWGMLYRSDELSELTDADLETFRRLGIRWVCDFRSDGERDGAADRLPAVDPPRLEVLPIGADGSGANELREQVLSGADVDYAGVLLTANREFATTFSDRYRALFDRLADPRNLPALIHCTAGKDRTGFGAALVLMALGVPRETAFQDYLSTNYYAREHIERALLMIRIGSLFRADPAAVRPLLEVRRAYLERAFEAIEAGWGSFDAYLREELHVTDDERERLQASLLH